MKRAFLTLWILAAFNAFGQSQSPTTTTTEKSNISQKEKVENPTVKKITNISNKNSSSPPNEEENSSLESEVPPKKPLLNLNSLKRDELIPLLGKNPQKAFESFELPIGLEVLRGESKDLDDVVSIHPEGVFLFWFDNHLWQMGFAKGFKGSIEGVKIGMRKEEVTGKLGKPQLQEEKLLVYEVFFQDFPVSIRFVLKENRVSEIYFYRSDL